jgi:large subunit ribosomal protein L5
MSEKAKVQQKKRDETQKALMTRLSITNPMAAPKVKKVVLNVGLKQGLKDPKFVDAVEHTLTRISGQKPVKTIAKKSIASFKIREGQIVGMMVTLRGSRMRDFLDKLVNSTFPRVRDFRGISTKMIDKHGNMTIGFKEVVSFPEVRPEDTDYVHGLEVTIVTDAGTKERGEALMRAIHMPFKEQNNA